ncbi:M81 family metallopeptidase [Ruixingdingia sedimenti]|uniref:M81 family metallopeptidase n=1 Tax=Ruixingdingia sedimenti TaxID=3073604 RepID=A0ABU1FA16_9RHOB|nr:M81 family metallopeptidase [Xinfangfangia sp. LG-4]MDR5653267.1 M81 family metallopeptidase [Xinfangfangia sp. LG-4]
MAYRIGFAGFNLESVTAVPQVAEVEEFERLCTRGAEVTARFAGTNTVPGGCMAVCAAEGAEFVPLFHTLLGALGPASDAAVERFTQEIVDGIAAQGPFDGFVLFLHGACWAPGYADVERHVIDRVRAAAPGLPLAVALDYHGNIDARTLAGADIAVGYRHSPHIDMGETGERATSALIRLLRTGRRPGLAVARPGVVIPSIMSATALEPLAAIMAEARAAGDCDISVMAGFAYADSANTGMSVIALDWAGQAAAEAKAQDFAARLHAARHAIAQAIPVWGVEDALADVAANPGRGRPVVLLEHADRMNDSTHLLRALLDRDLGRVAVPFLLDPASAAAAHAAGAGAEVDLSLGGHTAPETGGPVAVRARVIWAGPKAYTVSGRYQRGSQVDLGLTALVEVGRIRISIVSHFAFAVDGDPFTIFGERPEDYDVILLRSKTHFRDFYEPMADRILVVDTPDLGPADVRLIPYRQLDTARAFPWCDPPPFNDNKTSGEVT